MMMLVPELVLRRFFIILCFVPALLFAWLGQFSRLEADDFCSIALGQQMGAWDYMVYLLNTWSGSYASLFFKGMMAPLDTLLPRITPALIVVLWLIGLSWLIYEGLICLGIGSSRRTAAAAAALGIAAVINAFPTPQSFYWYTASIQYTLPLALLTSYMALVFWTARQPKLPLWTTVTGGALCFISAGSAEIFVGFQMVFLTLCLLACVPFLPASVRRPYVLVFGAGWLTTLLGLLIQVLSPGVAVRAAFTQTHSQLNRSLPAAISKTLEQVFSYTVHPQVLAGFLMLMGVGLLVMLLNYQPRAVSTPKPAAFSWTPVWLGLTVQLVFIPLLWAHTSDDLQVFGRFSIKYMTVIILNILFISSFLAMLWQRKRIDAQLRRYERGSLIVWHMIAVVFIFAVLLVFTQVKDSIHYRASDYLLTSFFVLAGIVIWQLLSMAPTASARRFGWLALFASAIGLVCMAAIVGVALYGRNYAAPRILGPSVYLLVLSGLVWGMFLGCLVKHSQPLSQASQAWIRLLKPGSLAIVLIIGMGIVLGQMALVSDLQLVARKWDARHQEIIARRDSGQTVIKVLPLTYDQKRINSTTRIQNTNYRCVERYYNVDEIVIEKP